MQDHFQATCPQQSQLLKLRFVANWFHVAPRLTSSKETYSVPIIGNGFFSKTQLGLNEGLLFVFILIILNYN